MAAGGAAVEAALRVRSAAGGPAVAAAVYCTG